jgi:hypothetical protein
MDSPLWAGSVSHSTALTMGATDRILKGGLSFSS